MADTGCSIEIELVRGEGECVAGHKVGDKFFVDGSEVRFDCGGLCIHALYSMLPKILAMRYRTSVTWATGERPAVTPRPRTPAGRTYTGFATPVRR